LPTLLGIHGSVNEPGRLYQALQLALQSTGERWETVTTSLLHLGDHQISFADGRPLSDYSDDTEAVVQRVMAADMYLIATPIFKNGDWLRANRPQTLEIPRVSEVPVPVF